MPSQPASGPLPGKPLVGVTVLDLTSNIAGPSATLILADLGARVIKVEPPGGDASRSWYPQSDDESAVFAAYNHGKQSIVIDAKSEGGRALLYRLAQRADVFVESMRPGKADELGLGWPQLSTINPRLIYSSVNAFGSEGPMASVAGFDAVIQAYSGLMDLTGYADGAPARVGGSVIDVGTGMWAAIEILAALLERQQTGRGSLASTSMLGTATSFVMHHLASVWMAGVVPQRQGTAQHNFAPYQAIKAADGMVMLGVNTDAMFRRAVTALGADALADDERFRTNGGRMSFRDELIAALEEVTQTQSRYDVVERLMSAGVPTSVVRSISDLADDEQLKILGLWGTTESGAKIPRTPVAGPFDGHLTVARTGQHTKEILIELGLDDSALRSLIQEGVVAADPADDVESADR